MADNPYAPSQLTGTTGYMVPARPVTPMPPAPATSTTYAPSVIPVAPATSTTYAPSQLDIIAHAETGDRNIPQAIHDRNTDRGTPAKGNFQFIDPTWQRQAPKAGVDIRQYPTAISAPPEVQARVAAVTPIREWGPNTVAALKARFPGIDTSKPPTGTYHGSSFGGAPATPGTTLNTPPPATTIANALTGGTGQGGAGLSPIQQAQKDVGGEGGQALQPAQAPQLMPSDMHNQQVAAQAPQLAATWRAAAAQPLTWGTKPFGSNAGPQDAPPTSVMMGGQYVPMPGGARMPGALGTTLNSNNGIYG